MVDLEKIAAKLSDPWDEYGWRDYVSRDDMKRIVAELSAARRVVEYGRFVDTLGGGVKELSAAISAYDREVQP